MVVIVNNNVIANLTTVMQEMALACVQKVGSDLVAIRVSSVNINICIYVYEIKFIICVYSMNLCFIYFRLSKWFYGRNCEKECDCKFLDCNPFNGTCLCPSGWIGRRCDQGIVGV